MLLGIPVAEYSPGSPSGYSVWCEALAPVADASISAYVASDAWSYDIVFGMPSSSIFTVSVVHERLWYELSLRGINLE